MVAADVRQLCERWSRQLPGPIVLWAEIGLRAAGLGPGSGRPRPYRILGLHNADADRLLGLDPPARSYRFEGYADNAQVAVESLELALYLERVRDGDAACIALPYSPLVITSSDLHGLLLEQVRFRLDQQLGALWSKQLAEQLRKANTIDDQLDALRQGLTSALALRTGELIWSFAELLAVLERPPMPEVADPNWIKIELDRAKLLLEGAATVSTLPAHNQYNDFPAFLRFCRDGEQP